MNKQRISHLLRRLGLIRLSDKARFYVQYLRTGSERARFRKANPGVKLPPAYFIYETFGLNYEAFYHDSRETAAWLAGLWAKYHGLKGAHILDWGCGPGRIIRHLPSILDPSCVLYGTDYNPAYVGWCRKNLPGITFARNALTPPTGYADGQFDVIYGISIFTHLSEEQHHRWIKELFRILKPGGIVLLTMQGEAFRVKLNPAEAERFGNGQLVVKAATKEGHRTYSAFQPPAFVHRLITPNQLLEHIPGDAGQPRPQQDVWIIRRT